MLLDVGIASLEKCLFKSFAHLKNQRLSKTEGLLRHRRTSHMGRPPSGLSSEGRTTVLLKEPGELGKRCCQHLGRGTTPGKLAATVQIRASRQRNRRGETSCLCFLLFPITANPGHRSRSDADFRGEISFPGYQVGQSSVSLRFLPPQRAVSFETMMHLIFIAYTLIPTPP